ncbi:MAG: alpha/beta hydrolase [Crocinitomicaceae bacterium]|nr:alpha/beta hydrolase [Crocinitomicaceae bacterium]
MQNPLLHKIHFVSAIKNQHAPTLVFLHDSLGCAELWRDFPEKLSVKTSCNMLVYDRQGYGKSCPFTYEKRDNFYMEQEADLLVELLEFWSLKEVILFGHSDGGSIALIAAGKYPDRISGVITEGAHIFVEDVTIKGIKEAAEIYRTSDLKIKLQKYHGDKTDALFNAWHDTWITDEFSKWNIEHFLTSVACPSLIIQGDADEYGTLDQVYRIEKQIGSVCETLILSGVKH